MKNLFFYIILLGVTANIIAQTVPSNGWAYGARISLNDPYFAVAVDSKGEALVAGGGNASNYNFTIVKRDTAGANVFTKSYVSRNDGVGSATIDANDDVLVISTFHERFELSTDTFLTPSFNEKHFFVGKFNGQNGNDIWVKQYSSEKPYGSQFLANGNVLLQIWAAAGDFYFDGNLVVNLTVPSYVFLELDNTDGSVVRHFTFSQSTFPEKIQFRLTNDILTYVATASIGTFNQTHFVIKRKYNVSTGSYIQSDSLFYKAQYNFFIRDIDKAPMWLDAQSGDWYVGVGNRTDYNILGTDTVAADDFALLHYDDQLNLKHRINVQYGLHDLYIEDTTLISIVQVPQFSPRIAFYGGDTVAPYNNVQSFMVVRSNLEHQNRRYGFMATDNWQTGLEFRDVDVDAVGNVYVLGFHENDIIFPPHVSAAANRSWKHHSALGKLQFAQNSGSGVSLNETGQQGRVFIYPNPCLESLTIQYGRTYQYSLFNQQGQLVKQGFAKDEAKLDMTHLVSGLYFLKLDDGKTNEVFKLIKL